jgi:hypothetical protein
VPATSIAAAIVRSSANAVANGTFHCCSLRNSIGPPSSSSGAAARARFASGYTSSSSPSTRPATGPVISIAPRYLPAVFGVKLKR